MSLFFGSKSNAAPEPSKRPTTRQRAQALERVQRKSRTRGARKAYDEQRRKDTLEAHRRILMGEVDVPDAVRRNVENHYRRLMEAEEGKQYQIGDPGFVDEAASCG